MTWSRIVERCPGGSAIVSVSMSDAMQCGGPAHARFTAVGALRSRAVAIAS